MDVHTAGHHHQPPRIESRSARWEVRHDAPALDAYVAHHTVHVVGGIVHGAAGDTELGGSAHSRSRSARTTSAVARRPSSTGRSGSGTSSIRKAVPPS